MQPDNNANWHLPKLEGYEEVVYSNGLRMMDYPIRIHSATGFAAAAAENILASKKKDMAMATATAKKDSKRHLNRDERHINHKPAPNNGKDTDSIDLSDLGDI